MKIVMLGAPGVGKGTAASKLSLKYNIPHISTGDLFRTNIEVKTKLGMIAKKYMDEGKLVPDEVTVDMLLERIASNDCKEGFILDGFPRTIAQAEALREALDKAGTKIDHVFNINAREEVIMERIGGRISCPKCGEVYHIVGKPPKVPGKCDKCGSGLIQRHDDNPETIKKRLKTYEEQTAPLVDFYRKEGILTDFDGNMDATIIFNEMTGVL